MSKKKKEEKVDPVELAIANLAKLRKKDSKTLTSAETSWVFIYAPFVDEIVRLRETISDQGW